MVRKVPDDWTPDQPHPDQRREFFCRSLSQGGQPSACYRAHIAKPNTTADSIKAAAWAVAAEEPCKARVEYLQREHADRMDVEDKPLTAGELRELMESVSEVLEECLQVGQLSGVCSPADATKLDRALTTHVGRLSRATSPDAKSAPTTDTKLNMDSLPMCVCDD